MLWVDVTTEKINAMEETAKKYGDQCIRLPKDLKEWQAYKELKTSFKT
jgi:dynein heavy chain